MSSTKPTRDPVDADAVVETAPTEDAAPRTPGVNRKGRVKATRAGVWWTALVMMALVSLLLLVFIAQNADAVTVRYLGFEGQLSLAVALLLSAALGALVVAIPGIARIAQLRHALRRAAKQKKH
ncbi:MAG: DUF1049 domain-containing protein [Actinomycetales bacterium]|nr:MAG: DUF1049 domain-containing protein [Actinomycetales bacterium]